MKIDKTIGSKAIHKVSGEPTGLLNIGGVHVVDNEDDRSVLIQRPSDKRELATTQGPVVRAGAVTRPNVSGDFQLTSGTGILTASGSISLFNDREEITYEWHLPDGTTILGPNVSVGPVTVGESLVYVVYGKDELGNYSDPYVADVAGVTSIRPVIPFSFSGLPLRVPLSFTNSFDVILGTSRSGRPYTGKVVDSDNVLLGTDELLPNSATVPFTTSSDYNGDMIVIFGRYLDGVLVDHKLVSSVIVSDDPPNLSNVNFDFNEVVSGNETITVTNGDGLVFTIVDVAHGLTFPSTGPFNNDNAIPFTVSNNPAYNGKTLTYTVRATNISGGFKDKVITVVVNGFDIPLDVSTFVFDHPTEATVNSSLTATTGGMNIVYDDGSVEPVTMILFGISNGFYLNQGVPRDTFTATVGTDVNYINSDTVLNDTVISLYIVTDDGRRSDVLSYTTTVINRAPVANSIIAPLPTVLPRNGNFSFTTRGAADPDNETLKYEINLPTIHGLTLSKSSNLGENETAGAITSSNPLYAGKIVPYNVEVTDGGGLTDSKNFISTYVLGTGFVGNANLIFPNEVLYNGNYTLGFTPTTLTYDNGQAESFIYRVIISGGAGATISNGGQPTTNLVFEAGQTLQFFSGVAPANIIVSLVSITSDFRESVPTVFNIDVINTAPDATNVVTNIPAALELGQSFNFTVSNGDDPENRPLTYRVEETNAVHGTNFNSFSPVTLVEGGSGSFVVTGNKSHIGLTASIRITARDEYGLSDVKIFSFLIQRNGNTLIPTTATLAYNNTNGTIPVSDFLLGNFISEVFRYNDGNTLDFIGNVSIVGAGARLTLRGANNPVTSTTFDRGRSEMVDLFAGDVLGQVTITQFYSFESGQRTESSNLVFTVVNTPPDMDQFSTTLPNNRSNINGTAKFNGITDVEHDTNEIVLTTSHNVRGGTGIKINNLDIGDPNLSFAPQELVSYRITGKAIHRARTITYTLRATDPLGAFTELIVFYTVGNLNDKVPNTGSVIFGTALSLTVGTNVNTNINFSAPDITYDDGTVEVVTYHFVVVGGIGTISVNGGAFGTSVNHPSTTPITSIVYRSSGLAGNGTIDFNFTVADGRVSNVNSRVVSVTSQAPITSGFSTTMPSNFAFNGNPTTYTVTGAVDPEGKAVSYRLIPDVSRHGAARAPIASAGIVTSPNFTVQGALDNVSVNGSGIYNDLELFFLIEFVDADGLAGISRPITVTVRDGFAIPNGANVNINSNTEYLNDNIFRAIPMVSGIFSYPATFNGVTITEPTTIRMESLTNGVTLDRSTISITSSFDNTSAFNVKSSSFTGTAQLRYRTEFGDGRVSGYTNFNMSFDSAVDDLTAGDIITNNRSLTIDMSQRAVSNYVTDLNIRTVSGKSLSGWNYRSVNENGVGEVTGADGTATRKWGVLGVMVAPFGLNVEFTTERLIAIRIHGGAYSLSIVTLAIKDTNSSAKLQTLVHSVNQFDNRNFSSTIPTLGTALAGRRDITVTATIRTTSGRTFTQVSSTVSPPGSIGGRELYLEPTLTSEIEFFRTDGSNVGTFRIPFSVFMREANVTIGDFGVMLPQSGVLSDFFGVFKNVSGSTASINSSFRYSRANRNSNLLYWDTWLGRNSSGNYIIPDPNFANNPDQNPTLNTTLINSNSLGVIIMNYDSNVSATGTIGGTGMISTVTQLNVRVLMTDGFDSFTTHIKLDVAIID